MCIGCPCWIAPLAEAGLSAMRALDFPAVQLFVERVAASGNGFELSDADAPVVGEICRRLDGIALAIELAAGCVSAWGLQETLEIPTNRFNLLRTGRRTAPPRHKTLSAMLDWSYDLLSEPERLILRRLSTFSSAFTLEDAIAVAADKGVDDTQVIDGLASLVNKSLVAVTSFGGTTNYRLLNLVCSYASGKLVEGGEADAIKRRRGSIPPSIEAAEFESKTAVRGRCELPENAIMQAGFLANWICDSLGAELI